MADLGTGTATLLRREAFDEALHTELRAEVPRSPSTPGRLALLVGTDGQTRPLLARLLSASGFRCLPAVSGEQALELLKKHCPNLGVLGIELPGMSGAELAWRIREQQLDLPLVAVSDDRGLWDPDDLADLGFEHVFAKPLDCEEFVRICGDVCAGDVAATGRLAGPEQ